MKFSHDGNADDANDAEIDITQLSNGISHKQRHQRH